MQTPRIKNKICPIQPFPITIQCNYCAPIFFIWNCVGSKFDFIIQWTQNIEVLGFCCVPYKQKDIGPLELMLTLIQVPFIASLIIIAIQKRVIAQCRCSSYRAALLCMYDCVTKSPIGVNVTMNGCLHLPSWLISAHLCPTTKRHHIMNGWMHDL